MRRFINADIVAGSISNAVTLNRFAYANGNPVSLSDPFGLSAADKRGNACFNPIFAFHKDPLQYFIEQRAINETVDQTSLYTGMYTPFTMATFPMINPNVSMQMGSKIALMREDILCWGRGVKDKVNNLLVTVEEYNTAVADFLEQFENYDGSLSLYDNMRFKNPKRLMRKNDFIFHEQIFVSETSPVVFSVNPNDTDINKGTLGITLFSADFTLVTGGWEAENWNFSLLDFFSFSASFGLQLPNKDNLKFVNSSFEMAIWKPSFSFELFDKEISLTAFVGGSAGGFELTENYQAVGLGIFKIGIDNKQGE